MAKPRKKWSTTIGRNPVSRVARTSQRACYDAVAHHRELAATGGLRGSSTEVWYDEGLGRGWQLFERIEHTRKDGE